MDRIAVVGTSGAGKTTLAKTLAAALGLPHLELDALAQQPGWTMLEAGEFRRRVAAFVAGPRWVVDGEYAGVGVMDMVWARADTVAWLDLPRPLVTGRALLRSVGRVITGEELWNGNREQLRNLLSTDPERNVVLWSWTQFHRKRAMHEGRSRDPRWRQLEIHRLRSPAAVRAWLRESAGVEASRGHPPAPG